MIENCAGCGDHWSGPPGDGRPSETMDDIRRDMSERITRLSKGPGRRFEERILIEALKTPSERDR